MDKPNLRKRFSVEIAHGKKSPPLRGTPIIGPVGCGKTTLVAALGARSDDGVDILPCTDPTIELFSRARRELANGRLLPASDEVSGYQFSVNGKEFSAIDAPGGTIFGVHDDRAAVMGQLAESDGMMLCLDPASEADVKSVLAELDSMLDDLPSGKRWQRVAICATKADVHWGERAWKDPSLVQTITRSEPDFAGVNQRLGNVIAHVRRRAEVSRAMWVSTYGFANDGGPNFRHDTRTLRVGVQVEEGKRGEKKTRVDFIGTLLDNWHPLNVVEPFLFLCGATR